ncbi:MAG: tRNA (adenosine(37)-N6)-dimethylallyltransferase MiaA [Marinirhabdus sp.]|nr:tRNA (adenosine(37)-N6)-dimethylallyltransferase MiaA [Marinirhabdus sp.]
MSNTKPLLVCVVGPTAIGKTALGIAIANHFSTEIISADSRQFYSEMTIGTAVPTAAELAAVPHHFIQNRSIFEPYSVGDFERDALVKLDELFQSNDIVVMVGGSGLYVDAVVHGLNTFPNVPNSVREQLKLELESHGLIPLQKELQEKDPQYYDQVDLQNAHRVIRALEVIRASGTSFSSFLNQPKPERAFETLYVGLDADRPLVYDRINKRVDMMMEAGLLEEAKQLYEHKDLNALQTVGYSELFRFLDRELTLEEAISEIKKNTRRFAKRQGTWFRKNPEIHWFQHTAPVNDILSFIEHKNAGPN